MKFLRLSEVLDRTGLSKTTLYSLMRQNRFPQSIPISDRTVAWSELELTEWLQDTMQKRHANRDNASKHSIKRTVHPSFYVY
jgi:prophage regulatory protein